MVCVCWLVVCSALDEDISVFDEISSDVLCLSVVVDGKDEEVPIVDNVVSSVVTLSNVDDSNVDMLVWVITVVNVD